MCFIVNHNIQGELRALPLLEGWRLFFAFLLHSFPSALAGSGAPRSLSTLISCSESCLSLSRRAGRGFPVDQFANLFVETKDSPPPVPPPWFESGRRCGDC